MPGGHYSTSEMHLGHYFTGVIILLYTWSVQTIFCSYNYHIVQGPPAPERKFNRKHLSIFKILIFDILQQ